MTNEELKKAVANLINQKGRHNTEVAYKRLVEVFNALADETQEKPHPTCDEACMYACSEAGTVLFKCDTPATSEVSWEESLRISDLPTIAECLENFSQDPTEDNAVCLVRDIMQLCRADQPKPIINNALADVTDIDVGDIPQNHIASVGNMVESAPTEAQTEGAVRVCPDLDRVCGDYLKGWCATCPKRNLHARNIRVTGFDNQESTPTETERQQFEAWFISEDAQKAASKQARGQVPDNGGDLAFVRNVFVGDPPFPHTDWNSWCFEAANIKCIHDVTIRQIHIDDFNAPSPKE